MDYERKINKFCESRDVKVFKVDFNNLKESFYIKWQDSLEDFLHMIESKEIDILFLNAVKVNYSLIKERIKSLNITKDSEEYDQISTILDEIKKIDKKYVSVSLMVAIGTNNIVFKEFSSIAEEFSILNDELNEAFERIFEMRESKPIFDYYYRKELIKPYAIELAEHPDYYKTVWNNNEQSILLDSILKGKNWIPTEYEDHSDMQKFVLKMDIIEMAKAHFKLIVEPSIDKERMEKILQWKKEKMTKVEMASRLGISKDKLNALFYRV